LRLSYKNAVTPYRAVTAFFEKDFA
jgi:hypothetical protein